jgi:CBS domain-containing protein
MNEFQDEYSAALEGDMHELKGALLGDTINTLGPLEPICIPPSVSVREAATRMTAAHQAAVLIVDADRRLVGIFTERDVLARVVAQGLDVDGTRVGQVMTPSPEALSTSDRVCYAVNRMSVAGYRTIPLVDSAGRPIGIVTVTHFIKWLADLFPEAILNLRPGDALKRPSEVDAG